MAERVGIVGRILFGRNSGPQKGSRTYSWNLAASIAYSAQSALLLLVVTRFGGLAAAGRFSIYYITTTMLASVGSYSMRNYQVSDAKDEYAYGTYLASRVTTCVVMMAICLGYALIWQPTIEGIATVLLLGAYRATDAAEDVIHAEMQKRGRLDAASVARTIRICTSFVAFAIAYALTTDMIAASAAQLIVSIAAILVSWPALKGVFPQLASKLISHGVAKLLFVCFPICASAVLYNFIANLPRYAIEASMTSEFQGIFNILFMPVFVIDMLSTVIFNPVVADMGRYWNEGDLQAIWKITLRQIVIIGGLSIACAALGYFIGCPVLGLVFGADLNEWSGLLALLLLLGGISALQSYVAMVLTVMRKQVFILVGYVAAVASSPLYLGPLVENFGLVGAGCAFGVLTAIALAVFVAAALVTAIRRRKNV